MDRPNASEESKTNTITVRGSVAAGFEPVRAAFEDNFRERDELGAACAVYYRGRKIVDLWGGFRDVGETKPWERDTMVLVFSTTKGVAATAMALARARGYFEYDDRIADHWPAFGRRGKREITVRQLLNHEAGLATLEMALTPETIADADRLAGLLASKRPDWEPGTRHGYHAFSLGWYEGELLRRTDPEGRSLGEFVTDEIADPLDLAFYIGLPDAVDDERVAEIDGFHPLALLARLHTFPPRMVLSLLNPWSLTSRAMNPFDISTPAELNDPAYRSVEIPAGNGIGTVRSLAKLYGSLAIADGLSERRRNRELAFGVDERTREALTEPPRRPTRGWQDVVLKTPTAYSLGFLKPAPNDVAGIDFGRSHRAFGAHGAGGSFAFADPDHELGFAYAPNRMGTHLWNDPRERALRDAVYECLPTDAER